jgi:putative transposase
MSESGEGSRQPYGQTFRPVRGGRDSEQRSSPPANTPLLPRGLKQPRRSSPRLQGFDYIGPYAYSITINTDDARPYFRDDRFVRLCIKALHDKATVNAFEVLAYCFMPNHVHLLAEGLAEYSRLQPFMQQFKQVAGFAFKQERGVSLWHRSYHDRVLRKDEDL